jgi:hypothetical protein
MSTLTSVAVRVRGLYFRKFAPRKAIESDGQGFEITYTICASQPRKPRFMKTLLCVIRYYAIVLALPLMVELRRIRPFSRGKARTVEPGSRSVDLRQRDGAQPRGPARTLCPSLAQFVHDLAQVV